MKMEIYIFKCEMSVVAKAQVLNIKDGLIGLMVIVWIHTFSPSPLASFPAEEKN